MEFLSWAWSCTCNPRIQEEEQEVKPAKRQGGRRGGGKEERKGKGRMGNIPRTEEETRGEERGKGKMSRLPASLPKPQQGMEMLPLG